MAYNTIKLCETCENRFVANSNVQRFCKPCKAIRRRERRVEHNHTYNMKNADTKNEESRAYNKSEKGRAAQKLRDAIRQGKIKRQPCEICQEPDAQGHHFDYSKPLEVCWLCPQHHREEHLFEPWQNEMRRAGYKGGFELSQLIEACGEDFCGLSAPTKIENFWRAFDRNLNEYGHGTTPTEAVAMLWLALHAKLTNTIE